MASLLSPMSPSDGSAPQATLAALQRARRRRLDGPEREWLERIDALRSELRASTATVAQAAQTTGDPLLSARDHRRVTDVCRRASTARHRGKHLFRMVREVRPDACLEMGTALGLSAAYQAAALELNGTGCLWTLEGSSELARVARASLRQVGLHRVEVREGTFARLLPTVARERRWQFVFIDGHHEEEATQHYFATLLPHVAPGGVIVLDDVCWSEGMKRAWRRISAHPGLFAAQERTRWGVCVVGS